MMKLLKLNRSNASVRDLLFGFPSEGKKKLRFNRVTLAFTGELQSLERTFQNDYYERSLNPFRFSIFLAIIFFDIFAFLDAVLLPDLRNIFWLIRFGVVTPVLIGVFFYSYFSSFRKNMQLVIAGIMYFTGLAIIVMIIFAARIANHYTYYAGLILIFIFGYTFIRARFIYASVAGWSIVISYEIAALWLLDTPIEVLINNNYFFISANIIGMFISYFLEVYTRRDFYLRTLLEEEQEKVKSINSELEKRVRNRTRQLTKANKDLKEAIRIRQQQEIERIKLEAHLQQLQKMETIGTLAGGVAHDFNNILTPILGYTEMALEELSEESTLRYDIEQINHAAIRGKDLVQQILTFSRQVDIKKKPLHLHLVIREVMKLISASFPSNIEIHQNLNPNCGTVLADETQMHQIVMNLCTNSYQAMMEKGGILEVLLDEINIEEDIARGAMRIKKGTYIELTVRDTGMGMDKQTLERIFEPFFTSKEVGSGSGLGLSVVQGIVANYHGFIEVESKVDEGTTFRIILPQHSGKTGNEKDEDHQIKKGKGSIMFVDDEKEITYMGKRMLESLGYTVDIRTDGQSALEDLISEPYKYDLLVTDQAMPNMLGTELIKNVREVNPNLKCIIITGFNESIPNDAKEKYNISHIVLKPLVLSEFSNLIGELLDN